MHGMNVSDFKNMLLSGFIGVETIRARAGQCSVEQVWARAGLEIPAKRSHAPHFYITQHTFTLHNTLLCYIIRTTLVHYT